MAQHTEIEQPRPSLLTRRWKDIKTAMYHLTEAHDKNELLLALLRLREEHTAAPTLSEITNFTGYDVAIHTIQGWDWRPNGEKRSLEIDAVEIGKFGAELMVVHTIRESIKNGLLAWDGKDLVETTRGEIHFHTLNSFNVDITGSRMDIARKRFSQGRLTKQQRSMDPVNNIPIVKRLYWENSILMLLRAPLPFYQAMRMLSDNEQEYLIEFHSKLISKSKLDSSGMVKVRLTRGSTAAHILSKLTPDQAEDERRPRFVACMKDRTSAKDDKIEFHVALGALTMFTMFLLGFDQDHLNQKAQRAENAVREVIEHSGYWKVEESNIEVIHNNQSDVITEIDIIARSKDGSQWITCEVKDFSFWKGWIFGHGAENRKEYYIKAVDKLAVKEDFIREKYTIDHIDSLIVTSVPEPYSDIQGIPLIYLSDLYEELARRSEINYTPRKRHQSSNYLIRYFERLQNDYQNATKLDNPRDKIQTQIDLLRKELDGIKAEYDKVRETYKSINSEFETLKVSEKLASKRLLMDTGEKHYQLEAELKVIRSKTNKIKREKKLRANILRDLKNKYNDKLDMIKAKERELGKLENSKERLLAPRLF